MRSRPRLAHRVYYYPTGRSSLDLTLIDNDDIASNGAAGSDPCSTSKWVFGINRNQCSASAETGVHFHRNTQDWIETPCLWERAHDLGVPISSDITPAERRIGIPTLRRMLEHFPFVTVVLDHLGNPTWDV